MRPDGRRGLDKFPVALAWGKHLFPFRTEQLSPTAPMVLGLHGPGRVGRRRFFSTSRPAWAARRVCGVRHRADVPPQGARAANQAARVHWSCVPDRRARPPRPDAGGAGWSGAPCRPMGDRRDADLRAWDGRIWPASARVTTEWPAVRVLACGGGVGPGRNPLRSLCLAQRRELRGRVHGRAHQLAERALRRAAGGRRGEHVFGRLGTGSDGTRNVRPPGWQTPRIWLCGRESGPRRMQAILQTATNRIRGATADGRCAAPGYEGAASSLSRGASRIAGLAVPQTASTQRRTGSAARLRCPPWSTCGSSRRPS